MAFNLNCPECNAQFNLFQALDDVDARRLLDLIKDVPPVVIKPLFRYLKLFKPAKQSLRWSRMLRLVMELHPMITQACIERNHATYVVTPDTWAEVMTSLVENPPATLKLPLKGHGYLLSIIAGAAEKTAAIAEQKKEEQKRQRPREGTEHGPIHVSKSVPCETNSKPKPRGWVNDLMFNQGGEDKNE